MTLAVIVVTLLLPYVLLPAEQRVDVVHPRHLDAYDCAEDSAAVLQQPYWLPPSFADDCPYCVRPFAIKETVSRVVCLL